MKRSMESVFTLKLNSEAPEGSKIVPKTHKDWFLFQMILKQKNSYLENNSASSWEENAFLLSDEAEGGTRYMKEHASPSCNSIMGCHWLANSKY